MKRSPTLDVESCRDLVEKLNREYKRFLHAVTREEQSDHAVNFSLTAWHLTDWVWDAKAGGRLEFKGDLAKEFEKWPGGDAGLKSFRKYILHRCGFLAYCEMVATAAKHADVDQKDWRPDMETTASASTTLNLDLDKIGEGWKWKIVDGENRPDALAVFGAILYFWNKLIRRETVER